MPRKDRTAKARLDTPLSPAVHHYLMVGEGADARLPGWVDLFATDPQRDFDTYLATAWRAHGDDLTAEAAAFDFVPWGARHRRPTGAGIQRWQRHFIEQHRY